MKTVVSAVSALALVFAFVACNPDDGYKDEFIVTGDAIDVTDRCATLTGYVSLPYELRDAEVGIMYDKNTSFENGKKISASWLYGKFTVVAIGLDPGTTYYFKAYVQGRMAVEGAVKSFSTKESTSPDGAVDLEIVMTRDDGTTYKLYWAISNLSESGLCADPEDYGDHFAWGETEPKADYSWETYKWCNGSMTTLTKYNSSSGCGTVDNKTVLDPEDDAAHVKLGGKWRMPTDAEWTALRTQCTLSGTIRNGVDGLLVSASNGNSIFLPSAGTRYNNGIIEVGSSGCYWSSSLNASYYVGHPYEALGIMSTYWGMARYCGSRWPGNLIRPVTE